MIAFVTCEIQSLLENIVSIVWEFVLVGLSLISIALRFKVLYLIRRRYIEKRYTIVENYVHL